MSEIKPFASEAEAVARLDDLARKRAEAKATEQAILQEIKDVLAVAGAQPFDRSRLIEHSGLARRTAYLVLPPRPTEDTERT